MLQQTWGVRLLVVRSVVTVSCCVGLSSVRFFWILLGCVRALFTSVLYCTPADLDYSTVLYLNNRSKRWDLGERETEGGKKAATLVSSLKFSHGHTLTQTHTHPRTHDYCGNDDDDDVARVAVCLSGLLGVLVLYC